MSELAEEDAVEPVTSAALAKVVGSVADHGGATGQGLLARMFGPAADEIGTALARWTSFRVGNAERIIDQANRKSKGTEGTLPPRIAGKVIDEGSWIDDELTTEYLSGVLAGSRSLLGKDDRGAVWASLVTGMSSLEIRTHFLMYRAWAEFLPPRIEAEMWAFMSQSRLDIDQTDFIPAVVVDSGVDVSAALAHALDGLQRRGLISGVAWGPRDHVNYQNVAFDLVVCATPSSSGMELYGWSLGEADVSPTVFLSRTAHAVWDANYPRLKQVALPLLGISAPE